MRNKESLGISNVVKKLCICFVHDIPNLPDSMKDSLLDEFTRLTCHFCDGAAVEESVRINFCRFKCNN